MSIDQTCLESQIQTAVDNLTTSCSAEVFLETAIAADTVNTNRKFTVALGCQLPDLDTTNIPAGTMVYVEELGVPVVSTLQAWKGLDGRTYRKDVPNMELWTWGLDGSGSLGQTVGIRCVPQKELNLVQGSCQTSAGSSKSVVIKTDGTLWSFGIGLCGSNGDNTNANSSLGVQEITYSRNWCMVNAEAGYSTKAVKTNGTLWSWGDNLRGELGDETTTRRSSPVQDISSSTNWCFVAAGFNRNSYGIKTDGTLWGWGSGVQNLLAQGNNSCVCFSSPVQEISSSTNWSKINSGRIHAIAIKTDGSLWGWGANAFGYIGDGSTSSRNSPVREICSSTSWVDASAGDDYSTAIKDDGTLWVWGYGAGGPLGTGLTSNSYSPIQEITSSTDWSTLKLISSNIKTSGAIKTNGTLWGWGCNRCGVIGNCSTINTSSPVQESCSFTDWMQVSGDLHTLGIRCYP